MTTIIGADLDTVKDRAMERVLEKVERKLMTRKFRRLGRFYNRPLPSVVTDALDKLADDVEEAGTVREVRTVIRAFVQQHNL